MKVMLPVKDGMMQKNELAEGFHNIKHVCIYDNISNTFEWIQSGEISDSPGSLNSGLKEKGVFSVICLKISPMVLNMFNKNGIQVFKAETNNISKNISLFLNSQLQPFTTDESRQITACSSKSCSGCSSTCN